MGWFLISIYSPQELALPSDKLFEDLKNNSDLTNVIVGLQKDVSGKLTGISNLLLANDRDNLQLSRRVAVLESKVDRLEKDS